MPRRVSPAFSETSSAAYGKYSTSSGYGTAPSRRTYLTQLPKVYKNRDIDSYQDTLTTASEAYGSYWAPKPDPADVDQEEADEPAARDTIRSNYRLPRKPSDRNTRPGIQSKTRPTVPASTSAHSLPPIRRTESNMMSSKNDQSDRRRTYGRTTNRRPPQYRNEPQVRMAAKVPSGFKISDIKRIDLDLYSGDGTVVSITTVPTSITSHKK